MKSKLIVILYVFFINLYITKNSVINSVTNRLTDILKFGAILLDCTSVIQKLVQSSIFGFV